MKLKTRVNFFTCRFAIVSAFGIIIMLVYLADEEIALECFSILVTPFPFLTIRPAIIQPTQIGRWLWLVISVKRADAGEGVNRAARISVLID
ncbi:hypothetical protein CKO40_22240 [Halochromatium glycolicum]|uniref:Uncharacterized protein n=1 Tax=Halochromatium glycolicum TaxID=85075 RepID=A0AAJ0U8I1_9GAMM|nr:hypothetical protein [Halochromatium glycolicum]